MDNNNLIVGILTFFATIISVYFVYRTASVTRPETREQAQEREANAERVIATTYSDLLRELRTRITELERENDEAEKQRLALMAQRTRERLECEENIRVERNRRYDVEKERGAAMVWGAANSRLVKKLGGIPIDYDPPNGSEPRVDKDV